MEKHFRIVPRGIGLVIGCCTFPTWNGYPGLFADLATGNAVVVKPHPAAILPLAITVRIAREVLAEAGFDPNVVTLVAHDAGDDVAQTARAAARGEAHRLHRQHRQRPLARGERAAGAGLHREGRRQPDRRRLGRRLQGRRAQRRLLAVALHRADVHGAAEHLRSEGRHRHGRRPPDVRPGRRGHRRGRAEAPRRSGARGRDPRRGGQRRRACSGSRRRARSARSCSTRRRSRIRSFREARIRTPLIVKLDAADARQYLNEWFGPIAFVIATDSTEREPRDRARRGRGARRADAVGVFDARRT